MVSRSGSGHVGGVRRRGAGLSFLKGRDIPKNLNPVRDSFAYVKRRAEVPMPTE